MTSHRGITLALVAWIIASLLTRKADAWTPSKNPTRGRARSLDFIYLRSPSHCRSDSSSTVCHTETRLSASQEEEVLKEKTALTRKVVFGTAFLAENIASYTVAPGADGTIFPQADLDLISNLLDPSVMANNPGYALFSFAFFNSFLWLPLCWGALLCPEGRKEYQVVPAWPFVVASTAFGGIGLYPYLALRRPQKEIDASDTGLFGWFEQPLGLGALGLLVAFLLKIFLVDSFSGDWNAEWQGLLDLVDSSQFASTTGYDAIIVSVLLLDPLQDDAKRRGYLETDATLAQAAQRLAPFLFPLFGILAWTFVRPKYDLDNDVS